ncbi:hypothetical protein BJY52DRAFT_1188586 [Lactarius psammicola]|nr:hypothetical protein BJY52DRAFT_1188586 [Lactarius psammicola]
MTIAEFAPVGRFYDSIDAALDQAIKKLEAALESRGKSRNGSDDVVEEPSPLIDLPDVQ